MTTEKMTVHKALSELKVIDSRIDNAYSDFVLANKHSNDKILGIPLDEVKSKMKSSYQKVIDLIKRRNAMKRAVVLSNACTIVKIDGVEYTVAEAIDMKNNGMSHFINLRDSLQMQLGRSRMKLDENSGEALEKKAEKHIIAVLDAQGDSTNKTNTKEMEALRAAYIANNTWDLIDPNNVADKIEELTNMIDNFMTEVDAALSVSNSLTFIEFEY